MGFLIPVKPLAILINKKEKGKREKGISTWSESTDIIIK
jgi:hypothetical protein